MEVIFRSKMAKVRHYPTTERPFLQLAPERGVLRVRQATVQGYIECRSPGVFDAAYPTSELRRARVKEGGAVSGTLMAGDCQQMLFMEY